MPEVQTTQQSGEMTQRFLAFVMMHAQQAGLFLGQIPHPESGERFQNLEAARLMIDQLEMIREKTRGNLTAEETQILTSVLSDLQMAFVKASAGKAGQPPPDAASTHSAETAAPASEANPPAGDEESRKRFSKSYG